MKKLVFALAIVFTVATTTSCTKQDIEANEVQTDPADSTNTNPPPPPPPDNGEG